MAIDWDTYTNTALEAVDPTALSADDLQTFREEMIDRGLSTIPPPTIPTTPSPPATTVKLQSPDGIGYELSVADDGSLIVTNLDDATKVYVTVRIPDGIEDTQLVAYDAASNRMVPAQLSSGPPVPGAALTSDADGTPLTDETGGWLTADPSYTGWLSSDSTGETLTNEAGTLALSEG